jgi:hypothetical protein
MRSCAIALAIVIALASVASGRIIHVNPDGSGDALTIAGGTNVAVWGDTVMVASGTYYEHNIGIPYGVSLIGETGESDGVAIIGIPGERVLCVDGIQADSTSQIRGLTISGGHIGMYMTRSLHTISNVTIEENYLGMLLDYDCAPVLDGVAFVRNYRGTGTSGLEAAMSSVTLKNCLFLENTGTAVMLSNPTGPGLWACLSNVSFVANGLRILMVPCRIDSSQFVRGAGLYLEVQEGQAASLSDCLFHECRGHAVYLMGGAPTFTNILFLDGDDSAILVDGSAPVIRNCTFVGNAGRLGSAISYIPDDFYPPMLIENSIIAYGAEGPAIRGWTSDPPVPILTCCDIYGNEGGDWVGCIADQAGINGNFSACPSFCSVPADDYRLCGESPCAAGNHPEGYACGLIGVLDVGCSCGPSGAEPTTWGQIKSIYR